MTNNESQAHDRQYAAFAGVTDDGELARFIIGGASGKRAGYEIPAPHVGHPAHGRPRAGFAGDYRPLACRLADPRAPKDYGVHATHGDAVRAIAQQP